MAFSPSVAMSATSAPSAEVPLINPRTFCRDFFAKTISLE
jgi:hypothetical protein